MTPLKKTIEPEDGARAEPITRAAMREADCRAIEEFGISGVVLMENAALTMIGEISKATSFTDIRFPE